MGEKIGFFTSNEAADFVQISFLCFKWLCVTREIHSDCTHIPRGTGALIPIGNIRVPEGFPDIRSNDP